MVQEISGRSPHVISHAFLTDSYLTFFSDSPRKPSMPLFSYHFIFWKQLFYLWDGYDTSLTALYENARSGPESAWHPGILYYTIVLAPFPVRPHTAGKPAHPSWPPDVGLRLYPHALFTSAASQPISAGHNRRVSTSRGRASGPLTGVPSRSYSCQTSQTPKEVVSSFPHGCSASRSAAAQPVLPGMPARNLYF